MTNKNITYTILIILGVLLLGLFLGIAFKDRSASITSYEECVLAGYPILESYPEQCKTPDGQTFTRTVTNNNVPQPTSNNNGNDISDLIVVDSIKTNSTIKSPLTITGRARGTFYFEASFPVTLVDLKGNILAQTPAQAQSDWMTTEFVPFKVTLNYTEPKEVTSGVLIFHNDNPSGLPENDREYRIPVTIAPSVTTSFNTAFTLKPGDKVGFSDTLVVELKVIEDSRCKPDVQCIWAGELSPVLIVGRAQSEIRLGTVTKQSITFGNYTFTLNSATETTANITIKKNN